MPLPNPNPDDNNDDVILPSDIPTMGVELKIKTISGIPSMDAETENIKQQLNIFGGGADPITAGFTAAAAFFNFLSTPQGQRVVGDILTIDEFFAKKVYELFLKIHNYIDKKA